MNYSDDEFLAAVESCTITSFHHADHIRLAWLYCERYGMPEAAVRVAGTIRRYAAHLGHSEKYHHTLTLVWVRLVDAARRTPPAHWEGHPELLNQRAPWTYYSNRVLAGDRAREDWVEPDLAPLP